MDDTDRSLIADLDDDPRRPIALIAERLGVARGTIYARLERMSATGAFRRHSVRLDPTTLGYPLQAIITAAATDQGLFARELALVEAIPEVTECVALSGADDVMFRVVARDIDHLYLIGQRLLSIPAISRTSAAVVLKEFTPYRMHQLLKAEPTS